MEITNYRKLNDGTNVYIVIPARTTHGYCISRDAVVVNSESDDNCAAFGPYLKTTTGQPMGDIGGDAKIFDNANERDQVVAQLEESARAVRMKYNSAPAREAREQAQIKRERASESAQIRREIDKMNDVIAD